MFVSIRFFIKRRRILEPKLEDNICNGCKKEIFIHKVMQIPDEHDYCAFCSYLWIANNPR